MKANGLRRGEKVLFGITGAFLLLAVVGFVGMEHYRLSSRKSMYPVTTHFDFSSEGLQGSVLFRDRGCTSCHRAVRNGTNNGVNLDGIGSRRTPQYLASFLRQPEQTYRDRTLDHGPGKEAAYVAQLPDSELQLIGTFLSELKATQGSPDARLPGAERSGFVDSMVKMWAPSAWKSEYQDVRKEAPQTNTGKP